MHQTVTKEQARRFLLRKHGLWGKTPFRGRQGVLDYVRQAGCVQYDPVDVCGKSHELALLTRVSGFTKDMLWTLLYKDRLLLDYWDKNMSILSVSDWPYLEPIREKYRRDTRSREAVDAVAGTVRAYLREHGHVTSRELPLQGRADWYWSATSLSRAALETLYFRGELVVHHKERTVKSYALAGDCLPRTLITAKNPNQTLEAFHAWQTLRRVGAVGLLWNRPSDAWLGMDGFRGAARSAAFRLLETRGDIRPVSVEGVAAPLYLQTADLPLLEDSARSAPVRRRAHFLAPLDSLLWDRKLISALFGFDYKWEIYTPPEKRVYSYYVLPVLYGERFAGRVEPVRNRKAGVLEMRRFWPEPGFIPNDAFRRAVTREAEGLAAFHGLDGIRWQEGFWGG